MERARCLYRAMWAKRPPGLLSVGSIDVDLNDLMPANKIADVLGCDRTLHLHLTDKKFHIRYLVGPKRWFSRRKYELGFCIK